MLKNKTFKILFYFILFKKYKNIQKVINLILLTSYFLYFLQLFFLFSFSFSKTQKKNNITFIFLNE